MTTALTLLRTERIKLLSTRSPWWCMAAAVVVTVAIAALIAATVTKDDVQGLTPAATQVSSRFGFMIMMITGVLAATTEYRFGTIRTTFLAAPRRTGALVAKAAVAALLAAVIGEVASIGSWALSYVLRPEAPLGMHYARDYRAVLGVGLVYGIATVIAVSVGILLRHTAGALTLVVLWNLLVESILSVLPRVGSKMAPWLPFSAADNFLYTGQTVLGEDTAADPLPMGPWASLIYFAAIAAVVLVLALVVAKRRDA